MKTSVIPSSSLLNYSTALKAPSHKTVTLEFETASIARSLYADDEKLLQVMEKMFGITIVSRDGWIKLTGASQALIQAEQVFNILDQERLQKKIISRQDFLEVLEQTATITTKKKRDQIQCSLRRPPVIAKTDSQRAYIKLIDEHPITFGVGPAGTGKTYLAVAKAIEALKQDRVTKIILTRPAVEAGEALGFLPGQLEEKILPYLRPLYDALEEMLEPEEVQRYLDKNIIQIAPLAYMRGRTLNHAFIILDEAQNTTAEQMFMFLTRIGLGSQCVITGDATQIDLPKSKPSGLLEALQALHNISGISFHHFTKSDVVRHPLVQAIIKAYQKHRS